MVAGESQLAAVGPQYQAAIDFLRWFESESGRLCIRTPMGLTELGVPAEKLVGAWLGIDVTRLEEERHEFLRQWAADQRDKKE